MILEQDRWRRGFFRGYRLAPLDAVPRACGEGSWEASSLAGQPGHLNVLDRVEGPQPELCDMLLVQEVAIRHRRGSP
jgi:hypothetical protein